MSLVTDPNDPRLGRHQPAERTGQDDAYLVLSEEERAKGFVRPVRQSYRHVGQRPRGPLRDLTDDEKRQYQPYGYVKFEAYPNDDNRPGRYWTEKQLAGGCGTVTTMSLPLAETYARQPAFYGKTYCCGCYTHLPVAEFVWEPDGTVVGS